MWRPGESDVSIRPGWFYHPAEDDKVKTGDQLVELFFSSVGRNSKLLLNVPPTRAGLLHDRDVAALHAAHSRLGALLGDNLAAGRRPRWHHTARSATAELDLGSTVRAAVVDLREDIEEGQRVARYRVEGFDGGNWIPLCSGTTIGYRRLDRIRPIPVRRLRVHLEETVEAPRPVSIHLYEGDGSRT